MNKERLSIIAAAAVKSAQFFSTVTKRNLDAHTQYASVVAGFKTSDGIVLVTEKKVTRGLIEQVEETVDKFVVEVSKRKLSYKITERAERKTTANDNEPRIEYVMSEPTK